MWLCTLVIILGVSGIWNFHCVFGESDYSMSILNDIRNELNNLKLSNERNERKIMKLENQVNKCHKKNTDLAKQFTSVVRIEQRLADIEHKVDTSQQELLKRLGVTNEMPNSLKRVPSKEGDDDTGEMGELGVDTINSDNANVHGLSDAKGRKSHIEKRIIPVTSQPQSRTKIAFTAYLSHTVTGLNDGHVMPFNIVNTNEGQGFDTKTHIFTCPVSGMYYFASSVLAPLYKYIEVEIVKNDASRLVHVVSGSTSPVATTGQGFNSVMNVCNKGTLVWVRIYIAHNVSVLGGEFTTFSGFLLWEL